MKKNKKQDSPIEYHSNSRSFYNMYAITASLITLWNFFFLPHLSPFIICFRSDF